MSVFSYVPDLLAVTDCIEEYLYGAFVGVSAFWLIRKVWR